MGDALDQLKVFTALLEVPEPKLADPLQLSVDEIVDPEDKHRGPQRYGKLGPEISHANNLPGNERFCGII
jgi:hypothetical protein